MSSLLIWATLISRALRRTGWSRLTNFKRGVLSTLASRNLLLSFSQTRPLRLFIFFSAPSAHSLSTSNSPAAMASTVVPDQFQHVLVMRHGHRSDMGPGVDRSWWTTVPRPWDAPLSDEGRREALDTGKNLRAKLEFPIHRVVTSPFLRCVETARELIAGLSTADDGDSADSSSSRIKVSIEYGMCEILNDISLWHHPTDHDSWGFDIKELEASFPPGVADPAPHRVYKEMPQWGESESGARDRYLHTIHSLVDRYPQENLLFVTHGEGVKVMASTYWKDARGHELRPDYFGYAHLKRQLVRNGNLFNASKFRITTKPDETGIELKPLQQA